MKKNILILILLFFVSCSSTYVNIDNLTPSWILNPQTSSKLSAVGCSQIHIKGIHAQKKLAIARAIEQIALQKNTKVDVLSYRKKTIIGNNKVSRLNETSSIQESHESIKTRIKDFYTNNDKEICVWVEER